MRQLAVALFLASFASVARAAEDPLFIRGDLDGSGHAELSDASRLLGWILLGDPEDVACPDAADADDNGYVEITDAVLILAHAYQGGPAPAAPFPDCGPDETPDLLYCSFGSLLCGKHGFEVDLEEDFEEVSGFARMLAVTLPGLDEKPPSGACVALPRPSVNASAALARAFPNLSITGIVGMYQLPGSSSKWFIIRRKGFIYSFTNSSTVSTKSTVLDISSKIPATLPPEGGLLSMAFHPSFSTNGFVYVFYTGPSTTQVLTIHISRFTSPDGGATLNPASEVKLLSVEQPDFLHHGGTVGFGPDNYLYIGLGDGSVGSNASNTNRLEGSMLRINVNSGSPYSIPPDNPYASGGGRGEIWAKGIRQPWRWSFDKLTGDLWLGDVGGNNYEEVNRIQKGKNYGWPVREGAHCYNATTCNTSGLTDPVNEYPHSVGTCVIGGFVYRGTSIPGLQGVYVFGDWGNGLIWGLFPDGSGGYERRLLAESGFDIVSFGQGHDGEIYAIEGQEIHKLVPGTGGSPLPPSSLPALLSDTPYVDPSDPKLPAPCMIPYDINVPFWSDGAAKERWLAIPDGQRIHIDAAGDWVFPTGTVFMKNFYLGTRIIETRLFMLHPDGVWGGYSYEWNDAETDAALLSDAKTKTVNTTPWTYPSGTQCLSCHSEAAGRSLGPETSQMNRSFTYPTTGRTANQLATYEHIGLFDAPLSAPPESLPALPPTGDTTKPLASRARAYLHSNCSHCHRPNGPGRGPPDFRYAISEAEMGICNVPPTLGDLGVPGALLLDPGDPTRSIIALRMHATDEARMPPIARNLVDWGGISLVESWIASLTGCEGGTLAQPVILDDGQAGTSSVGYWPVSGGSNPFGTRALYSKVAGATYTFQPAITAAGEYEVFLWWTTIASRLTNVPVEVTHSGGTSTVTVNQQTNGGRWNSIGRWNFSGLPRITIRSLGPGSTCADAVKLEPVGVAPPPPPPPPPGSEVILDNGAAGTKAVSGGWSVSSAPNFFGASSIYSKISGSMYRYIVPLPSAGTYDVYAWWTEWPSRMTNVPIDITHSGGTARVTVNQQANGGKWNLLGSWSFGSSGTVIINAQGTGTTCADAVRFVKR